MAEEKGLQVRGTAELDARIAKEQKTLKVVAITEGIVCAAAFVVGMLSVLAALSGAAETAALEVGYNAEAFGGRSASGLLLLGGGLLIVMALAGALAVLLAMKAVDDASYARSLVLVAAVTCALSVIALIVSVLNGTFVANMSILVVGFFFSMSLTRVGLKLRNLHLNRRVLARGGK